MKSKRQRCECGGTVYRQHCTTRDCRWLVCKACGALLDMRTGISLSPPVYGEPPDEPS